MFSFRLAKGFVCFRPESASLNRTTKRCGGLGLADPRLGGGGSDPAAALAHKGAAAAGREARPCQPRFIATDLVSV